MRYLHLCVVNNAVESEQGNLSARPCQSFGLVDGVRWLMTRVVGKGDDVEDFNWIFRQILFLAWSRFLSGGDFAAFKTRRQRRSHVLEGVHLHLIVRKGQ